MNPAVRLSDARALDRALVDAIRLVLGMAPLYAADSPRTDAARFAARTWAWTPYPRSSRRPGVS